MRFIVGRTHGHSVSMFIVFFFRLPGHVRPANAPAAIGFRKRETDATEPVLGFSRKKYCDYLEEPAGQNRVSEVSYKSPIFKLKQLCTEISLALIFKF